MKILRDIPELSSISKIDNFGDLLKINEFVFSVVPQRDELTIIDDSVDFFYLYESYKRASLFGWCHANAVFMHLILKEYYRDSFIYNYGIQNFKTTHTVLVVTIGGFQYLIDPYFCKHYEIKGKILFFEDLCNLIKSEQINNIIPVYGKGRKPIYCPSGEIEYWTGKQLEESVLNGWNIRLSYDKQLDNLSSLLLLPKKIECTRILRKSSGQLYWEFF